MKQLMQLVKFAPLLLIISFSLAYGDDSAAEVTPAGLQFKELKEVSIEREDLSISLESIDVSMTFINNSSHDISTTVAFPIPDYKFDPPEGFAEFNDFSVEVDGKPIEFKTEAKAIIEGKDYAKILNEMHVPFQDINASLSYLDSMSDSNRDKLIDIGIIDTAYFRNFPSWSVRKKYYWTQVFPAGKSITVKHRYTPYFGFNYFGYWKNISLFKKKTCADKKIMDQIESCSNKSMATVQWVSYILKSALNWKQPMKVFHLTVCKPQGAMISTCFRHHLTQIDPETYEATINNFIPDSDLSLYFIQLPENE